MPRPSLQSLLHTARVEAQSLGVLRRAGLLDPRLSLRMAASMGRWRAPVPAAAGVWASMDPSHAALVDDLGPVSYAELDGRTNALAHGYMSLGISSGDRVGIMCRNHRGIVEALGAVGKLGVGNIMLNTGFAVRQFREVLEREGASGVVCDSEFLPLVTEAVPDMVVVVTAGARGLPTTSHGDLLATNSAIPPPRPRHEGATVVLTSGTTGTPKGAQRANPKPALSTLAAIPSRIPYRRQTTVLMAAPIFHAWGMAQTVMGLVFGSTLVLHRRFDPERVLAAIERHQVDTLAVVPVMLQRILSLPSEVIDRYDTSSLRVVASSGSVLPGELSTRWMDTFGDNLYNFYGSTEVAQATVADPIDLRVHPGTAGRPPLGTTVCLLDDAGHEVAAGEVGRVFVANQMQFSGYTGGGGKEMVDGMMSTGDLGRFDDGGRLMVLGRQDDMIVSGGENVYPSEVEDLLDEHPEVLEAVVVGVPDDEFGQRLKAVVVLRPGASLDAEAVRRHVRSNLANYKVPREVVFMDELPRNATGKVLRRELV